MSVYYTPKRDKNLYDPASKSPFKLSRSRIEVYMQCPRCFYLDRRLAVRKIVKDLKAAGKPIDLQAINKEVVNKFRRKRQTQKRPHV